MKDCLGIINLDERNERIIELTRNRTIASLPIAGRYRVVDFVLSNMTNSGIESIAMFANNKSRSLIDHLTNGRPWDLHRKKEGLRVFNFGDEDPTHDDVNNFFDNIDFIEKSQQKYVLISPSYMICNIDYTGLIEHHKNSNNDITVVYKKLQDSKENFEGCEVLNIDENSEKVFRINRKIKTSLDSNINMEMYIMKKDLFLDIINQCINTGLYRKVTHCIKENLDKFVVGGYKFEGYLACINSLRAYYNASMDFLNEKVNKELFYSQPIYTKPKDEGPTQYTESSSVKNSIIANGTLIEGTVENSVIGRRVHIAKGSIIKNSIILQNSIIEENVILDKVILDKANLIKKGEEAKGLDGNPVAIVMNKIK